MRHLAEKAYWACERTITPGLRYSQMHYEDALSGTVRAGVAWLDVGCGKRILPVWRAVAEQQLVSRARTLTGLDPDLPSLRDNTTVPMRVNGFCDGLPFKDESFDLVTANMVVEHVADPADQFGEILRVLRPGGLFLFHTPNLRAYTTRIALSAPNWMKKLAAQVLEERNHADVFPTFYRANTDERIREIAGHLGFEIESIDHVTTSAQAFAILPIALLELIWIRQLMKPRFEGHRQTLLVRLRKPVRVSGVDAPVLRIPAPPRAATQPA